MASPWRQGRPNVSEIMTASGECRAISSSRQSCIAERSGSSGRRTTLPFGALETSTPPLAQTNPWCVSTISTPRSIRTMRLLSRKTTSTMRGSLLYFSAHCCARAEGAIVSKRTIRPSALLTIFWATTKIAPGRMGSVPSALRILSHKLSPGCISGIPSNPRMRISLPDILDYPFCDPKLLKQPAGPGFRIQLGEPQNIRGVIQV